MSEGVLTKESVLHFLNEFEALAIQKGRLQIIHEHLSRHPKQ